MHIEAKSFNQHKIWYYSARPYKWKIQIDLFDKDLCVGKLLFMKEGYPTPDNYLKENTVFLYYAESDFKSIFKILSEYSSLQIQLSTDNGIGCLGSA